GTESKPPTEKRILRGLCGANCIHTLRVPFQPLPGSLSAYTSFYRHSADSWVWSPSKSLTGEALLGCEGFLDTMIRFRSVFSKPSFGIRVPFLYQPEIGIYWFPTITTGRVGGKHNGNRVLDGILLPTSRASQGSFNDFFVDLARYC